MRTVTAYAYAVDKHNNLVTTEVISLFRVMGRLMLMVSSHLHASGQQTITAGGLERHLHLQKFSMLQYYQELQRSCNGCGTMISANWVVTYSPLHLTSSVISFGLMML